MAESCNMNKSNQQPGLSQPLPSCDETNTYIQIGNIEGDFNLSINLFMKRKSIFGSIWELVSRLFKPFKTAV